MGSTTFSFPNVKVEVFCSIMVSLDYESRKLATVPFLDLHHGHPSSFYQPTRIWIQIHARNQKCFWMSRIDQKSNLRLKIFQATSSNSYRLLFTLITHSLGGILIAKSFSCKPKDIRCFKQEIWYRLPAVALFSAKAGPGSRSNMRPTRALLKLNLELVVNLI
ncbi:hypothetical protein VNO77_02366 [Canavalia gladiata]|uniref:Uncharacterized protein n=1 Tax=Canavalia gladiata TaxID=3824 RepID=A0AAN9R5V5_CANGL